MHVIVIGSGVIGTTSAYYLTRLGHQVTVLDRQMGAGLETSFANAGQVSPGYSAPWAAPGIPLKALKWLLSKHSPLVVNPRMDWPMLRFMLMMLRNCTQHRYELNKGRMLRIAEYSRRALGELRAETGIHYDERTEGTLQLFRTTAQVRHAREDMLILAHSGVPHELLNPDGCIAAEPALARVREKIAGGLRLPLDETGDCFAFTDRLSQIAADNGADFQFGINVQGLTTRSGRIDGVQTDQGQISGDAYVLALGSHSPALLRPLGIDLPVYPVKGYSLTLPVVDPDAAPRSTVMDETHKVAVTRLGERIRVAGTAELTGFDLRLPPQRRGTVAHVVSDLFPDGGDLGRAEFWTGLRPMTPDGTPVVGPTPYSNLFVNTGHGTLGWTMSCGSARLVADLVSGRAPELDIDGLTLQRYSRRPKPRLARGRNLADAIVLCTRANPQFETKGFHMSINDDPLFSPIQVGELSLPNRIILAPLTRSRAGQPGDVPTPLMAEYYAQRASAGLTISEATNISEIATGYALTPGIYTPEQVAGWRLVTDAVHAAGGRMVLQLWHCGRMSHESLHPGRQPVAPSAIHCEECQVFTVDAQGQGGLSQVSPPHTMTIAEIEATVADYAIATRNAMAAGFDGVEVHGANGYLLHQFLASNSNQRDDAYGGSLEGRSRFVFEVMDAVLSEVPAGRVGVRLSPLFGLNGINDADPAETQGYVAAHLNDLGIAYLHVADTDVMAGAAAKMNQILPFIRPNFSGVRMLNGAYDPERARAAVSSGDADLIAFGRLYLANPDLPERIARGGPYNEPNQATFYGGGAEGYTDYPSLAD